MQNTTGSHKPPPDNYEISPYRDDDDDDDDDLEDGENDAPGNRKTIPDWARGKNLRDALEAQAHIDPDVIFGARRTTVPLDELFGHPDPLRSGNGGAGGGGNGSTAAAARYDDSRRGSSGNWADDGATWAEELAYKRAMGYPVPGAGGPPIGASMGPPPPPQQGQQPRAQQQQQQPSFLSRRG